MEAILKVVLVTGEVKYVDIQMDSKDPEKVKECMASLSKMPRVSSITKMAIVPYVLRYTESEVLTEQALFGGK